MFFSVFIGVAACALSPQPQLSRAVALRTRVAPSSDMTLKPLPPPKDPEGVEITIAWQPGQMKL